ncbi:UDP-glycosyltransferase UGT5-like [Eupeodes corollae]|uniref:UDP-glycosyltransferase UGT5-like n=1 Tax=Eupeodes corollae TaxID=290404 RepID=UPI0024935606|nr:UDP-glycosyltransferase UGT5-like [Eupeodes corollae]
MAALIKLTKLLILSIIYLSSTTFASNILCLFTSTGQSHLIIHMAIARTLADRGHNVTVVTTLPLKDLNPKYNHIYLPPEEDDISNYRKMLSTVATGTNWWQSTKLLFMANVERVRMQDGAIRNPRFQELLNNPGNHFDLLILGIVFNNYQIGVAAHFKCPIILSWINQPPRSLLAYVGSPWSVSSVGLFGSSNMLNFKDRLKNFLNAGLIMAIEEFSEYKMAQYYEDHFSAERYPSFDDMNKNISLVFGASHFSEGRIRPLTPGFVEIGGIQVKEAPETLPKDIEEFLKTAKDGFILFSLGTNIKSKDISANATTAMFKVLSQSKYKIIWKWDSADLPGESPNIMFKKWLPQDDLLAHPKLKLFITHGGKGSLVEAQYHGVPMLTIPMYGDQPANAQEMAGMGYGLIVNHRNVTEQSFRRDFYEVLENPVYLGAISSFSKIYRDRPLTPRQSVIYWTEYVIRHHGAKHMQSPAVHMNLWQKNSLDVIAFLVTVLYLGYWILRRVITMFYKLLMSLKERKLKSE